MKRTGWMIGAAALLADVSAIAADKRQPLVLSPDTAWAINYADDSCRLARTFAGGKHRAAVYLEQYGPGAGFDLLVAGTPLRGLNEARTEVRFGPEGAARTIDRPMAAEFGKFGPAVMASGLGLIEDPASRAEVEVDGQSALVPLAIATSAQERAITWVEVQVRSRAPFRLELGPMDKAMEALRTCSEELVSHWGIDVAAHRTLTKMPTPKTSPARWVSSNDYPSHLVARGVQGIIKFRLSIAEDGKVSDCHIQQSTRPVEFDKAVCDIMSRRARFDPALDAAGKPIKSYWRSTFRFVMP